MGQHADDAVEECFERLHQIEKYDNGEIDIQELYDMGLCDEQGRVYTPKIEEL